MTRELESETIVCQPKPNDGVLELDIVSTSEVYTVPFDSVYAVAMDLAASAHPSDADGVVTITFAIVHEGASRYSPSYCRRRTLRLAACW